MDIKNIIFGIWIIMIVTMQDFIAASPNQNNPLNDLYNNLLQREYTGPISFQDHSVERRAQRSPSLRLRFGRSDPSQTYQRAEKRWFGDVNQKPIRSPSLRLRFGRRSDPLIPLRNENDIQLDDYLPFEYEMQYNRRQNRQPSKILRWGRSTKQFFDNENEMNSNNENDRQGPLFEDLLESLNINSDTLHMLLDNLRQNDMSDDNEEDDSSYLNEFDRETRKTGRVRQPLRLRWGRSPNNAKQLSMKSLDKQNLMTSDEDHKNVLSNNTPSALSSSVHE